MYSLCTSLGLHKEVTLEDLSIRSRTWNTESNTVHPDRPFNLAGDECVTFIIYVQASQNLYYNQICACRFYKANKLHGWKYRYQIKRLITWLGKTGSRQIPQMRLNGTCVYIYIFGSSFLSHAHTQSLSVLFLSLFFHLFFAIGSRMLENEGNTWREVTAPKQLQCYFKQHKDPKRIKKRRKSKRRLNNFEKK